MPTITYTIPADKAAEFAVGFLKRYPIPLDENAEPTMSQMEWIKECGRRFFVEMYTKGRRHLAIEDIVEEQDLIT